MSAIKHLILNPKATLHAGDRSWERDVDWETVKHVAIHGTSMPSKSDPNVMITEHRDPNNLDHHIKIVTDRPATKIITVIRDTSRPMKDVELRQQQQAAAAQAQVESKQRSARNRKAQLEKKHKRNPPKNKK